MPFYLSVNGHISQHSFDYITDESQRRLEPTLVPGKPQVEANPQKSATAFAIEVMSKKLITIAPKRSAQDALALYRRNRIHHIPVVEHHTLLGMLSDRDLSKIDRDRYQKVIIEQIMEKTVLLAHEETALYWLAKVMIRENISSVPIIGDKQKITGIVTTRDILKWVIEKN